MRESIPRRDAMENSISKPDEAPRVGSDPQRAVRFGVQGSRIAVLQIGCVFPVINCKSHSVKADQPLLGSEPKITILGLCDGLNGVLRKTILNLPDIMGVNAQGLGGIGRNGR